MYYLLLPIEPLLDNFVHTQNLHPYVITCFVSTDPKRCSAVTEYLNRQYPCELFRIMNMANDLPPQGPYFQMKPTTTLPFSVPEDTTQYPYNILFPDGIVNREPTLEQYYAYNQLYFQNELSILDIVNNGLFM